MLAIFSSLFLSFIIDITNKTISIIKGNPNKYKVKIKSDNIDRINISSNTIVYNDKVLEQEEKKEVIIEKKDDDLTNKRLELISLLRNLKDVCENTAIGEIRHKPSEKVKK